MSSKYSIANTTRAEREDIVRDSIGNVEGLCDGCSSGVLKMYQPYIDGEMELAECNMAFRAKYIRDEDEWERPGRGYSCLE